MMENKEAINNLTKKLRASQILPIKPRAEQITMIEDLEVWEAIETCIQSSRTLDELERWAEAWKGQYDTDPRGKGIHSILFAKILHAIRGDMTYPTGKDEPKVLPVSKSQQKRLNIQQGRPMMEGIEEGKDGEE
jgi:hypothetical protein